MRLVEDDGVVLRQHSAAGGQVGEVQRVVRDHEIGRGSAIAGRLGEARAVERAAPARTAIGADGELGPERVRRLDLQLGTVAGLGRAEPVLHGLPGPAVATLGEQDGLKARELAAAEVVLAALQHLDPHSTAQRGSRDGHVVPEQLLLQRLRRRRDHDPEAGRQSRDQVREALADPGAGLGDEVLAGRERALDLVGEGGLLRPRLVGKARLQARRRDRRPRPSDWRGYVDERTFPTLSFRSDALLLQVVCKFVSQIAYSCTRALTAARRRPLASPRRIQ